MSFCKDDIKGLEELYIKGMVNVLMPVVANLQSRAETVFTEGLVIEDECDVVKALKLFKQQDADETFPVWVGKLYHPGGTYLLFGREDYDPHSWMWQEIDQPLVIVLDFSGAPVGYAEPDIEDDPETVLCVTDPLDVITRICYLIGVIIQLDPDKEF